MKKICTVIYLLLTIFHDRGVGRNKPHPAGSTIDIPLQGKLICDELPAEEISGDVIISPIIKIDRKRPTPHRSAEFGRTLASIGRFLG